MLRAVAMAAAMLASDGAPDRQMSTADAGSAECADVLAGASGFELEMYADYFWRRGDCSRSMIEYYDGTDILAIATPSDRLPCAD